MKPHPITARAFASARRRFHPVKLAELVTDIEQAYRMALGIEPSDDAMLCQLSRENRQPETEKAAWVGIAFACFACRSFAGDSDMTRMCLDNLQTALAEADADRIAVRQMRSAGGQTRGNELRAKAATDDAVLANLARKLLREDSRLSFAEIGRQLAERGYGNADRIRKKLPRLLTSGAGT